MQKIKVAELCLNFEQKLRESRIGVDSLKRYHAVLVEFTAFSGNRDYSQSLGAEFLVSKLKQLGGLVSSDEGSRKEVDYFKCMRMLAEFHFFGIIHRRNDFFGEIIWPEPFRKCTEGFFDEIINDGLSYGYLQNAKSTIHDLILFLDAKSISDVNEISVSINDEFIRSFYNMAPKSIERKLCYLRRYYRYLHLNGYIDIPLAERLPKASIQGRMSFPTVWDQKDVEKILHSAERISPSGKRAYAMVLLAARLGLRIGDIRNLKLSDIDWEIKQISICQHKTGKLLVLPLPMDVGWALIDYLKNGRPVTNSPNVFVRHRVPYDSFPINNSLNHILSGVLNEAGIQPEKRNNTGWHTFRRSLATNLLRNSIDITTISEILGHSDPDTAIQHYIRLDTESLRKCALEVEVGAYVK